MLLSQAPKKSFVPSLAVAGSASLWGLWWIAIRALDAQGLSGHWASVALFACATPIMLPLVLRRGTWRRLFSPGVLAVGSLFALCLVTWNHALIAGDVVRVTLLFYLAPIWGTIIGFWMFGHRIGLLRLMTILLGLAGAVVVLGFEEGLPTPENLAEWMALGSGMLFALGAAAALKVGHMSDFECTFATFALATLFALLFALSTSAPAPTWVTVGAALPILGASTLFWYVPVTWLMIWGAAQLDPGRVSILLLLEVVVAAVSAGLLTDEPFGWREAVGGLLILTAGILESIGDLNARLRLRTWLGECLGK